MWLFLLLLALLLPSRNKAGEIIGGHEAKPHSRPYMAFLRIQTPETKTCGGFLVQKDFVMTAAHCWGNSINVILGAHNIKEKEKTQQHIPVRRAIPYKTYNKKTYSNDIMLLQLERKAHLSTVVSILSLPQKRVWVNPGQVCSVAGWGFIKVNKTTVKLHEVELEVQKDEKCISHYKNLYSNATQICVGDPKKSKSPFKGDSGGPLICNNVAQGIVSFGNREGKPPHVYTRISSYLSWIKKTMRDFKLQGTD
ncbi:mast cell protease 1A-like isoform X11 [Elephas maximus indicus]|uniref:mast cell protease 1A-like isoform X11 n=1 Tax=Elephas maximus indicus TaxID=99487 RepID=UPI0021160587|nr:mast cell protease 1A-like isoform X11 [Elephas maximus indicus]